MSGIASPNQLAGTLPSDPRWLPCVRAMVAEGAELAGFGAEDRHRWLLAITEAWANVIRHAYGGSQDRRIDFRVHPTPGRLVVEIEDFAKFVDPKKIASRPLGDIRPGGLGVHLIHATIDEVEYRQNEHGGTTLILGKNVSPADTNATERGPVQ